MWAGVRPGLQILWVRSGGSVGSIPTHFRQLSPVCRLCRGWPLSSGLPARLFFNCWQYIFGEQAVVLLPDFLGDRHSGQWIVTRGSQVKIAGGAKPPRIDLFKLLAVSITEIEHLLRRVNDKLL